jgi:hypothetical protein
MTPIFAKARVTLSEMVTIKLDDSAELFRRFQDGYVLRIVGGNQVFTFNLTDTSQMLPALLTCAQNRGALVALAENPFVPVNSATNSTAVSATNESKNTGEAIALAANLLSAAGVQNFTLLDPSYRPDIKGDARWIEGSTFGTLNVFPNATASDIRDLPAYLIGADAKTCSGTFFSGAIPDDGTGTLARVFTTCQKRDQNEPITIYYLAVPRKAGGAYVISTISFGSEKPAKETDTLLRSAVFKILSHS